VSFNTTAVLTVLLHECARSFWPSSLQRVAAEQALKTFQEHPDAWTRVDSILEKAKTQQTKYFALQASSNGSSMDLQFQGSHWHAWLMTSNCRVWLQVYVTFIFVFCP